MSIAQATPSGPGARLRSASIYPPEVEAREHVFEPLRAAPRGDDGANGYPNIRQYDIEGVQSDAYERGLAEGKKLVDQDLSRVVHAMGQAVHRWKAAEEGLREAIKHDMLRLVMAIARQVVMCELRNRPEAIGEIVEKLLSEADGKKVFALCLHPDDVARVQASPVAHLIEQSEIVLRASDDVGPGGCLLETAFGRLDARLETRIQELAGSLLAGHESDADPASTAGRGAASE
jgi:flagellar assembly protein FliH